MSTLAILQQEIAQDIKPNEKKNKKLELNENSDLFGTLISNLLKEENPDNNSNFLINKIVDKSANFEKSDNLISNFSKGSLKKDHEIGHISIQELLEIAIRLKKGEELPNFPTDSKTLKIALSSHEAIKEFKNATNIQDLLKIAKKHDIKVKNFQFFKEEVALLPKDKKILSNIKSEDIFKLIDKKIPTEKLNQALVEKNRKPQKETSLLQEFLFAKNETKKEIKSKSHSSFSHEKVKDLTKDSQKVVKTTNQKLDIPIKNSKNIQPKNIEHEIDKNIKINNPKLDTPTKNSKNIEPKNIKHEIDENIKINNPKLDTPTKNSKDIQPKDIKHEMDENIKINNPKLDNIIKKNRNITTRADIKQESTNYYNTIKKINQQIKNIQANLISKEGGYKEEKNRSNNSTNNSIKHELTQKIQHSKIFSKTVLLNRVIDNNTKEIVTKNITTNTIISEDKQKMEKNQEFNIEEQPSLIHQEKSEKIEKPKFNHDLKKTFNTFARDFKEQVDNYKAPLMKIKMQLNPKNMGDVDVTLINRGNNLHVNIQANANTLAMFLQNHVEFKNSLINMGFSTLQMNFGEHNKDRQNEQQKKGNSKNSFENEESENREVEDINIVIPRYI